MIEGMVKLGISMSEIDFSTLPNWKVITHIADQFRLRDLPLKSIGKITVEVSDDFWEDEEEAKQYIENFCILLERLYKAIEEEFGEDADIIFSDMASDFSLTYNY